jgi:hypothetical protein
MQILDHHLIALPAAYILILEYLRSIPSVLRKEEHQVVLQIVEGHGIDAQRRNSYAIVTLKIEAVDAPIRGDELVLLADRFAQNIDLNVAGHFGQCAL